MSSEIDRMSAAMPTDSDRKRAIRRTALWLAIVAAAFYVGFIVMSVMRSTH